MHRNVIVSTRPTSCFKRPYRQLNAQAPPWGLMLSRGGQGEDWKIFCPGSSENLAAKY